MINNKYLLYFLLNNTQYFIYTQYFTELLLASVWNSMKQILTKNTSDTEVMFKYFFIKFKTISYED